MEPAMKDRLYLLTPDFTDEGFKQFCSECAMVEGMLSFYPAIRKSLDIKYVKFTRPRPDIVAELGPENQSSPVIILADPAAAKTAKNVKPKTYNGKVFLNDPYDVCEYLAAVHGVGRPRK
jgi:hypothetical protein